MSATRIRSSRILTSEQDARAAQDLLARLEGPDNLLAVERAGTREGDVPPQLGRIIQQVVAAVAAGQRITVETVPEVLTTTTAAKLLGVSRPTVMRMIQEGALPAFKVGSHHRLHAHDVFAALRERRERERAAFAELMDLEDSEA